MCNNPVKNGEKHNNWWETLDVISLLTLVWVNHCKPILHISKRTVHLYYVVDSINPFAIGYTIKPSRHFKKVFI